VVQSVLYTDSVSYLGGAEINLLTTMAFLDRERYSPVLATCPGDLSVRARKQGELIYHNAFPWLSRRRPWVYANSIWQLMNVIRRERISIVHTNCPHTLPYAMQACYLVQIPYVSHLHDLRHSWFEPKKILALNRARYVIAVSRAVADRFAEAGVQESRIRVIYNPFDLDRFELEPLDSERVLRERLGIPKCAFAVGIVGQVLAAKGHEELVLAAPQVVSDVPNAHFVVAGGAFDDESKAFKSHLCHLIDHLGLNERFHFVGFRDDIPAVMKLLDVLVVPSWTEGFGRVVVEGLAAGCPVVGTSVGGIPEIIEDGTNGLLVPPQDVESLAMAIAQVAQGADLQAQFRRMGPKTAKRFGARHHANEVQALYDSVLKGNMRGVV